MPTMETSAFARPSLRRPIPFTVVTIGRGVWPAAPVKLKPALWPAALCNPANAAVAAACFRKLRRSIPNPRVQSHGHLRTELVFASADCRLEEQNIDQLIEYKK